MIRGWIFTFASALSLLLCTAIVVLWVRSCVTGDLVIWSSEILDPNQVLGRDRTVTSSRGLVEFEFSEQKAGFDPQMFPFLMELRQSKGLDDPINPNASDLTDGHWKRQWRTTRLVPKLNAPFWSTMPYTLPNRLGFRLFHLVLKTPYDFESRWQAVVPYWFLAFITAILPVAFLVRFAKSRLRYKKCCCVKCGYNLTGNVSGVCPECGTAVKTAKGE